MQIMNLTQGSDAWHEFRANRFTASEAAAVFGDHKYMSRDQLLHQKATGEIPEVTPAQQRLYDKGHAAEAAARPVAEKIIGKDLFPVTVEDDEQWLAASMDGLTMIGIDGWEHKLYSEKLVHHIRDVKAGVCELDNHYRWQMDQQMAVSGAERILFMCSDGTEENCEWVWYERDEQRIAALTSGWQQFEKDLAEYKPKERKVEVVAAAQTTLPAPWAEVKGEIAITDNLIVFGQALTNYVSNINLKPQTDQEFADLEAAVKNLKDAEEKLTQCEEAALAKLESVAVLRGLIADYRETARQARLTGEKAVKVEKENRKLSVIQLAQEALRIELAAANEEFAPVAVTGISADFYGATKGLKTISSMESKCNDTLARAKIELNAKRDQIRGALKIINDAGSGYKFLFNDLQQLAETDHGHLKLLVDRRVSDHKAAEDARIEREAQAKAERMREEERLREASALQEKIDQAESSVQEAISQAREAGSIKPDLLDEVSAAAAELASSTRPAPTQIAPRPAQMAKATRPTDREIIRTLASHYNVSGSEVIDWLADMDMSNASEQLAASL